MQKNPWPWALATAAAVALWAVPAQAATSITVQIAPPAPHYEAAPPLRHGYVWVPGHWEWRHRGYVWVPGYQLAVRQGYDYRAPRWVQMGPHWTYEPGGWVRGRGHGGGRDRDRDGIPDRYDRDRDNDGRPNHRDWDRDGDGVPNRRDHRPDNPRRY